MLLANLRINLPFFAGCEVIIVNDDPSQSIIHELKGYPITLIENKENLGFAGAVNVGIHASQRDFIYLLNNDVIVKDDTFKLAVERFKKDTNVFAVGFLQEENDGDIGGKNRIYWSRGLIHHSRAHTYKSGISAWAEGGAALFDKRKLLALGGFDERYNPFYWEDVDLSFRAWLAGYTIFFDERVRVIHKHESTVKSFYDNKRIENIAFRNQLLFNLTHAQSLRARTSIFFFLVSFAIRSIIQRNLSNIRVLIEAVQLSFNACPKKKVPYKRNVDTILKLF